MQLNKTKNIVYLKDVESNIIDEAIIILKNGIKIDNINNSSKRLNNINVVKEAEIFINSDKENSLEKEKEFKRKYRFLKILNIILIIFSLLITFFKY